jgi:ABC-type glycerol-3-phosphate transport system substrate-binding protein
MLHWFVLDDDALAYMEELAAQVGADLTYNQVANDQMRELHASRIASGDLADLFEMEDYQPYVDAQRVGYLANISELVREHNLTNIQEKLIDRTERLYGDIFREEEGYFGLPAPKGISSLWYMVYRKDWADEMGLSYGDDESLEAWTEFVTALSEHDDDTIGFVVYDEWMLSAFIPAFTGYNADTWARPSYQEHNGEWIIVEAMPGYRDFLIWARELYDAGVLDPEFIQSTKAIAHERILNGDASAGMFNSPILEDFEAVNPGAELAAFPGAPKGPNGHARSGGAGYYKQWLIGATSGEAASEAAAKFLDLMLSDEVGQRMTAKEWGPEDDPRRHPFGGTVLGHGLYAFLEPLEPGETNTLKRQYNLGVKEEEIVDDPRSLTYSSRVSEQYEPEVKAVITTWFTNFILGNGVDPSNDSDWEEYLAALDRAGAPELIEDISSVYP